VIGALLAYGALTFLPEAGTTPEKVASGPDSMWVSPSPLAWIERGKVTTTDKDGNTESHGETEDDKESQGTVRIQKDTTTTNVDSLSKEQFVDIAIETEKNRWFPDLTKRSTPVRILNESSQDVIYTPSQKGFFEWDPRPSLGFGVVSLHPSVVAGVSPLRVGPVRLGVYVSVPTRRSGKMAAVLDVSTRVFDHLETGIGLTHRKNLAFSVRYRF